MGIYLSLVGAISRSEITTCLDHLHLQTHKLGGKLREMLKSCFGVTQLDYEIFAFNNSCLTQSFANNSRRGEAGGEAPGHRIPTLRTFFADWARAITGHAAAAPPKV